MTRRRVLYIPEPTGAGIVRLRKVEVPPTGIDALQDVAERIARLEQRLSRNGTPQPQPQRRTRQ